MKRGSKERTASAKPTSKKAGKKSPNLRPKCSARKPADLPSLLRQSYRFLGQNEIEELQSAVRRKEQPESAGVSEMRAAIERMWLLRGETPSSAFEAGMATGRKALIREIRRVLDYTPGKEGK